MHPERDRLLGTVVSGFTELEQLLKQLPDQTRGIPTWICETGEPYVEFAFGGFARPGDEATVEEACANTMLRSLYAYLSDRNGRIYWREFLEFEIKPTQRVLYFDEAGPDTDVVTNRKCVLDTNWVSVKCYCRLYAAHYYVDFEAMRNRMKEPNHAVS